MLACAVPDLPDTVRRLQSDLQDARRSLAKYHEGELDREAAARLADAIVHEGRRVVRQAFDRRTIEDLKGLALRLTAGPGMVALLGTGGDRAQFVLARSEDLALDLRPALQAALGVVGGGKGGGTRIVQGGGGADVPVATVRSALEAAAATLGIPQ